MPKTTNSETKRNSQSTRNLTSSNRSNANQVAPTRSSLQSPASLPASSTSSQANRRRNLRLNQNESRQLLKGFQKLLTSVSKPKQAAKNKKRNRERKKNKPTNSSKHPGKTRQRNTKFNDATRDNAFGGSPDKAGAVTNITTTADYNTSTGKFARRHLALTVPHAVRELPEGGYHITFRSPHVMNINNHDPAHGNQYQQIVANRKLSLTGMFGLGGGVMGTAWNAFEGVFGHSSPHSSSPSVGVGADVPSALVAPSLSGYAIGNKVLPSIGPYTNLVTGENVIVPVSLTNDGFLPFTVDYTGEANSLVAITSDTNTNVFALFATTNFAAPGAYTSGLTAGTAGAAIGTNANTFTWNTLSRATAVTNATADFDRIVCVGAAVTIELYGLVPAGSTTISATPGRVAAVVDNIGGATITSDVTPTGTSFVFDNEFSNYNAANKLASATLQFGRPAESRSYNFQVYHDMTSGTSIIAPETTVADAYAVGVSTSGILVMFSNLPSTCKVVYRIRQHFMLSGISDEGNTTTTAMLQNTAVEPIGPPYLAGIFNSIRETFTGPLPRTGSDLVSRIKAATVDAVVNTGLPAKMIEGIVTHGSQFILDTLL